MSEAPPPIDPPYAGGTVPVGTDYFTVRAFDRFGTTYYYVDQRLCGVTYGTSPALTKADMASSYAQWSQSLNNCHVFSPRDDLPGGVGGPLAGSNGPDGEPSSTPPPDRPQPEGSPCTSQVFLILAGLPITGPVLAGNGKLGDPGYFPPSNGMQAPVRVYRLSWPENASGTGLDYSVPPLRFLLYDKTTPGNLAPDAAGLPSTAGSSFTTYEVEALPIDGYRTPPRGRYGSGCGVVGYALRYTPAPGPGLLKSPVRVSLSEDSSGLFQDNRVQIDYLEQSSISLHTPYRIGTETAPDTGLTAFEFISSSLDRSAGLVTYSGQTLLGRLANEYPFPAGYFEKPPPTGYSPKDALEGLLRAMRGPEAAAVRPWIGWEELPQLYLRGASGPILPTLDALVIEKPSKVPGPSAQDVLKQFFEPFSGYGFRVSRKGRLQVTVPPWHPARDAVLRVTQAQVSNLAAKDFTLLLDTPNPRVTFSKYVQDLGGAVQPGVTEATPILTSTPTEVFPLDGQLTCRASYDAASKSVKIHMENAGVQFSLSVVGHDSTPRPVDATLTDTDLGQGGTEVLDESNIANVCTATSQGYVFQTGPALQPASARLGDHYPAVGLDVTGAAWPVIDGAAIGGESLSITVHTVAWAVPGAFGGPRELVTPDRVVSLPLREGASVTARYSLEYSAFSHGDVEITFRWRKEGGVQVSVKKTFESAPTHYDWQFTLSATSLVFGKSSVSLSSTYGESDTDLAGLSSSKDKYGRRETTLSTGVYQVSLGVLQSMARAVVQDRMYPRAVYTYPLVAPYALRPEHKYVQISNLTGTVTAWNYTEGHTPQQSQSSMSVNFAVLHNLASDPITLPDGSTLIRATERRYARARWGYSRTPAQE